MDFRKIDWLLENLQCTNCQYTNLVKSGAGLACNNCGAEYSKFGNAFSFLSDDIKVTMDVAETENVSYRAYDGNAGTILHHVEQQGGVILDCGSGQKDIAAERLIQLEIAPYPNVDVLAVNQNLPFKDNVFDAVFSLDVLEHVNDPFTSAKEIARVLKPGGILYLDLPFLQAEHGYPFHFFNATRMGVVQLFRGLLDVDQHIVPQSGHPVAVLTQVLQIYADSLPEHTSKTFRSMSVQDILSKDVPEWLKYDIAQDLPREAQWLIASATQGILRKTVANPDENTATTNGLQTKSLPGFNPDLQPTNFISYGSEIDLAPEQVHEGPKLFGLVSLHTLKKAKTLFPRPVQSAVKRLLRPFIR